MLPYVPVPTVLPGSINQPQDAVDNVVVATVNPMVQAALNGVAWRELIGATWGVFTLQDGTFATTDYLRFNSTPLWGGTGFTVSGTGDTEIHFAAPGIYAVGFSMAGSGGLDDNFSLSLDAGGLGTFAKCPCLAVGSFMIGSVFAIVPIINIATQFLQLYNGSTHSVTVDGATFGFPTYAVARIQ